MKLYVARHGQTDWNLQHKAQGRTDIPLNETGIRQAETLRKKIKNIQFTAVYSSPLQRVAKTAQIATNNQYNIIYDDRLTERSFGEFEGKIVESWSNFVPGVNIKDINLNKIPGGVETVKSMIARMNNFIESLRQTHADNAKILIVSSNGILKALDWILGEHSKDAVFGETHFHNAEIKEYEL